MSQQLVRYDPSERPPHSNYLTGLGEVITYLEYYRVFKLVLFIYFKAITMTYSYFINNLCQHVDSPTVCVCHFNISERLHSSPPPPAAQTSCMPT